MRFLLSIIFVFLFVIGCGDDDNGKRTDGKDDAGENADRDSGNSSKVGMNTKKTIGEKGGELELDEIKIEIPEGASSEKVEIGIKVVDPPVPFPDGYVQASAVYECTPHGIAFDKPVNISISFEDKSERPHFVLRLDDEDDTTWEVLETSSFENGVAILEVERFSFFAVVYLVEEALSKPDFEQNGLDEDASTDAAVEDTSASTDAGETHDFFDANSDASQDASECTDYPDCEDSTWPSADEFDCNEQQGHWECTDGHCVAGCNQECDVDLECGDHNWQAQCVGNWDCVQGLCEETCDSDGCGDNTCDEAGGETFFTCPDDCAISCAVPSDCAGAGGVWNINCDGHWICDQEVCVPMCDYSTCGDEICEPDVGEDFAACGRDCEGSCQTPDDCTDRSWTVICEGSFTCFMGECQQTCDTIDRCGDGTCNHSLGETAETCFRDCLGGFCEQVTDCLGLRWYDTDCPLGGYWNCQQPADACEAVCDGVLCGDGFCDVLGGEAATSCPSDCQDWDCNMTADCDPLTLPDNCEEWICSNRNCVPICGLTDPDSF